MAHSETVRRSSQPPRQRHRAGTTAGASTDDVIVRLVRGKSTRYALGRLSIPDQFTLPTSEAAVAHALAFAAARSVGAWLVTGDDKFVLLGTFSKTTDRDSDSPLVSVVREPTDVSAAINVPQESSLVYIANVPEW